MLDEAKDLRQVGDAKSNLEGDDLAVGGSVEVGVDSVEVDTLGNHGKSLTNDLDNVVDVDGGGDLALNTVDKADELLSQGNLDDRLDLEIICVSIAVP